MNKKLQKIITDISEMESTDLSAVVEAVKMRRNRLHFTDAQSFRVGDRVSFAGRHGRTEKGVVEKVKIKYILVRTDGGTRWNVPGSHLTKEKVNA
jgi:starvation-inducible outer membrane lipoprotein